MFLRFRLQVGRLKALIVPEPVRALQEIEAMGAAVTSEQAAVHVRLPHWPPGPGLHAAAGLGRAAVVTCRMRVV
jgi:hypothetical protein